MARKRKIKRFLLRCKSCGENHEVELIKNQLVYVAGVRI